MRICKLALRTSREMASKTEAFSQLADPRGAPSEEPLRSAQPAYRAQGFETFPVLALILYVLWAPALRAERLPIKNYTTADGLPQNTVMRIVKDSHGFLWFCTLKGLSRFDGYAFANYGAAQGIPGQIADLLETGSGPNQVLYQVKPHSPTSGLYLTTRRQISGSGNCATGQRG